MASISEEKIVAIHQPNFFPWLGYFHKIAACDFFVFHDNVEHSKRYPTRRTMIRKSANDCRPSWLTVPLVKHSDFALIKDLEIDHSQGWEEKHLRKLKNSYSAAPYFGQFFPILEDWLHRSSAFSHLADFNIFLIKNTLKYLGIERPLYRYSDLPVEGRGSNLNISLVKYLGGSAYLSGAGGKNYQDELAFEQAGISLIYGGFSAESFDSMPFCARHSIVEALLSCSPDTLVAFLGKRTHPG